MSILPRIGIRASLLVIAAAGLCHATPFAYISKTDGTVAVIDTERINPVATVNVGGLPAGIGIVAEGRRAYVANTTGNVLSVVDTLAHGVIANIAVPPGPTAAVLNAASTRLYVLHPGASSTQLTTLNTENSGITGTIVFSNRAERLAINAAASRVYVSHNLAGFISVVDTSTNAVTAIVATDPAPFGMAYDANQDRLYVAAAGSPDSRITIINAAGNAPVASVVLPGCASARNVAVNPRGTRLFASCEGGNTVARVDLASLSATAFSVGPAPTAVDITPDGEFVYVVNSGDGTVSVLQEDNPIVVRGRVAIGGTPNIIGRFIGGPTTVAAFTPNALTGLFWNPSESGWGIHLTQRRNTIFAAWYTYDPVGAPRWYVASSCNMSPALPCPDCVDNAFCSGKLYEVNGPRFFRDPFDPRMVNATEVGLLQLEFRGRDAARMTYALGSRTRTLDIRRQVFRPPTPAGSTNYTDLWWNPSESGWGLGVTHQSDVMFLTWFVYEDTGRPIWYVASNCRVIASGDGCIGTLYRTSGPPGPVASNTFDSSQVRIEVVGTVSLAFTDPNNAMLSYTVNNITGSKAVTRQLF